MQTKQALLSKKRETEQEFESHLQQKRTEIFTNGIKVCRLQSGRSNPYTAAPFKMIV